MVEISFGYWAYGNEVKERVIGLNGDCLIMRTHPGLEKIMKVFRIHDFIKYESIRLVYMDEVVERGNGVLAGGIRNAE